MKDSKVSANNAENDKDVNEGNKEHSRSIFCVFHGSDSDDKLTVAIDRTELSLKRKHFIFKYIAN